MNVVEDAFFDNQESPLGRLEEFTTDILCETRVPLPWFKPLKQFLERKKYKKIPPFYFQTDRIKNTEGSVNNDQDPSVEVEVTKPEEVQPSASFNIANKSVDLQWFNRVSGEDIIKLDIAHEFIRGFKFSSVNDEETWLDVARRIIFPEGT